MNNDLFFIPLLQQALRQPDRKGALIRAFERIQELGEKPEHQIGHRQFESFLREVHRHVAELPVRLASEADSIAEKLALDLVAGAFGEDEAKQRAALETIRSRSDWLRRYEILRQACDREDSTGPPPLTILLEKGGREIAEIPLDALEAVHCVDQATPGHYALKLVTGRLLWEGELDETHLLWSAAFPERDLELAASSGKDAQAPTLRQAVLGGAVTVEVFPGLESGSIHITLREAKHVDR